MSKQLSEISAFKYAEKMGGNNITNMITSLVNPSTGATFVTEAQLSDVFYKIRHKSFNFIAKMAVIELYKKGIIRLIYNPTVKLTTAVPYFKCKLATGYGVIINISNYANLDKDGNINIQPLTLYTLMLSAAFSLGELSNDSMLASNGIPTLYADLMNSVLARLTNLDMISRLRLKYAFTKFMYVQLGFDEVRASRSAIADCKDLDRYIADNIDETFPADSFNDLESLINFLREHDPKFKTITFGTIFDRWIRSYGTGTAFAVEYIPSFITMFISLITNSQELVNVKAIEKEANKNSKQMELLFARIENVVITLSQR